MSPFIPSRVQRPSACDVLIVIAVMTTLEGAGSRSRSRMAPTCEERETFGKAKEQLLTGTALYLYFASHTPRECSTRS